MKTQTNSGISETGFHSVKSAVVAAMALLFVSPMMLRGAELLLNGSFDDNSAWTVVPAESTSWTCIANGEANLHPVVPTPPYIGPVITQTLSVAGAGGKKLHFAAVMSSPAHPAGNTIAFQLEYLDTADITRQVTIANPDNNSILALTSVTADLALPLDAKTITKFLVTKTYEGMFTLQSVSLDLLTPPLAITSPAAGAKIPSGQDVLVNVAVNQGLIGPRSVEIREGASIIGTCSTDKIFGEWSYPDGSHLSVLQGTGTAVKVDYSPPNGAPMFLLDGSLTSPNVFTGTFMHWDNVNPTPWTGNATVTFTTTASGQLNAAINGDSPLNTVNLTGAASENLAFHLTWNKPPVGTHTIIAVVTHTDTVSESLASNPVTFSITPPATAPEIAVENPAGTNLTDGVDVRRFGNIPLGRTSGPKVFTIRNTGTASLTGLAISKNGTNPECFNVGTLPKTTLTPGDSTTFTVTFTPSSASTQTAAIHIKSNDADENPFDIRLAGNGYDVPEIAVEQPAGSGLVDGNATRRYGNVAVGQTSVAKIFTIRNTGTADLTGLSITKTGANPANFFVSALTATSLAPATSTSFRVRFKPTATGTRTAAIHIKSNDADENPFDIQLSGFGVKP